MSAAASASGPEGSSPSSAHISRQLRRSRRAIAVFEMRVGLDQGRPKFRPAALRWCSCPSIWVLWRYFHYYTILGPVLKAVQQYCDGPQLTGNHHLRPEHPGATTGWRARQFHETIEHFTGGSRRHLQAEGRLFSRVPCNVNCDTGRPPPSPTGQVHHSELSKILRPNSLPAMYSQSASVSSR